MVYNRTAVFFFIVLCFLCIAGCTSSPVTGPATPVQTILSQDISKSSLPTGTTPSLPANQGSSKISSMDTRAKALPATPPLATLTIPSDSLKHFYICGVDSRMLTLNENKNLLAEVNILAVNWRWLSGANGDNDHDNLNTIPLKLEIEGHPNTKIIFTSAGGGGCPSGMYPREANKNSENLHLGYWILDLQPGDYVLNVSTPDATFRKNVSIPKE